MFWLALFLVLVATGLMIWVTKRGDQRHRDTIAAIDAQTEKEN